MAGGTIGEAYVASPPGWGCVCASVRVCVSTGLRLFPQLQASAHDPGAGVPWLCLASHCGPAVPHQQRVGVGVEDTLPAKGRPRVLLRCLSSGSVGLGPVSAWTWHCGQELA